LAIVVSSLSGVLHAPQLLTLSLVAAALLDRRLQLHVGLLLNGLRGLQLLD
jgi:hypothetical protein